MPDNLPAQKRSELMQRIRSKDTTPELLVRRYLHGQGFRFRLHDKNLPGRPDIVLPRYRVAIFVQGCFWHQHGIGCGLKARAPRSNQEYWAPKLVRNVQRDNDAQAALRAAGWTVLVVWECELKKDVRGATLCRISNQLLGEYELWLAA